MWRIVEEVKKEETRRTRLLSSEGARRLNVEMRICGGDTKVDGDGGND